MKILFNTYPMAFHTPGGGEIQLKAYEEYLPDNGVFVDRFDQWSPAFGSYDLVHFFSCIGGSIAFCGFVKSLGLPLLISPNLWITEKTKHLYPVEEIRSQLLLSDGIVVNSDMEGDVLSQVLNVQRDRFYTVYNAVDQHFFLKSDPSLFCKNYKLDRPFVLNVGNIEPRKNQLNLIRALKSFPELKLVVIGHQRDPQYASTCFSEAGQQLQYIEALPHNSELLRSAYAACEVFVLPSTLETPGIAALEAAAVGAKVIVTSEGSTREYFGDLVDYVDFDNVKEIATAISTAIETPKTLIGMLYIRANFTWEHVTKRLADLYRKIQGEERINPHHQNFFPVERSLDGEYFFWSSNRIEFEWEPGCLTFTWSSVVDAKLKIFVNGQLVIEGLEVTSELSSFTLKLNSKLGQSRAKIVIKVNSDDKFQDQDQDPDPRKVGVAINNIFFEPTVNNA